MKARYADDTAKGPGNGLLHITEAGSIAGSEDIRFSIKRASDQQCLSGGGWQPAESFLLPAQTEQEGDAFRFMVGPAVVDNLDPQETYRLTLQAADGTRAASSLQVPTVSYSPLSGGQGMGFTAAKPEPKPAPLPEPRPQAPEALQPAPAVELTPPPLMPQAPPAAKGSSKMPLIILLVLALLGGGGFAAWKFLGGSDTPTAEAPVETPLAQARKHLAGAADPAVGTDLALKFRAEKDGADAAFLLAEDAAGKDNPKAMLLTGDFYSPADNGPAGTIQKDPLQAFLWYTKAKAAGNSDAEARLNTLKAWAETEAGKGSAPAKALLEKFAGA